MERYSALAQQLVLDYYLDTCYSVRTRATDERRVTLTDHEQERDARREPSKPQTLDGRVRAVERLLILLTEMYREGRPDGDGTSQTMLLERLKEVYVSKVHHG